MRGLLVLALLVLPVSASAQAPAQRVTLAEFKQLRWLHGAWRGSGGAYAAFYEEYRPVNDSTIVMRAFSDSTFTVATDSSLIEWRDGAVRRRSARSTSPALEVRADRIRFARFTFTRVSADQWTATLHPATVDGRETVYVMRRARR